MDIYGIEAQEAIEEYKATLSALQEAKDRSDLATRRIAGVLGIRASGYFHPEIIKGYIDCWERSVQLIRGSRLLESDVLRERGVDDGQPEG